MGCTSNVCNGEAKKGFEIGARSRPTIRVKQDGNVLRMNYNIDLWCYLIDMWPGRESERTSCRDLESYSSVNDSNTTGNSALNASKITAYKPQATAVSSALQSNSNAVNLLTRTRSIGATMPTEGDGERERKKQRIGGGPMDENPMLRPSTRSPLQVAVSADAAGGVGGGYISDEDDNFFSLMDPLSNDPPTGPVSARLASSSFFRSLDEAKENTKAAPAAEAVDDRFAGLLFRSAPLDFNLHSKIRFTSHTPFDWMALHTIEVSRWQALDRRGLELLHECGSHCSSLRSFS
jgi:hypothetical protein